ncbi:MAG: hypothetical protein P3W94_009570, partial [Paracoccus sp. (in: a-proteobacteria)]|nr:hypothetical protein [Paracoccus sp. (in: a-proteobacteria)]
MLRYLRIMFRKLVFLLSMLALAETAGAAPLNPADALACGGARVRGVALALREREHRAELRWLT